MATARIAYRNRLGILAAGVQLAGLIGGQAAFAAPAETPPVAPASAKLTAGQKLAVEQQQVAAKFKHFEDVLLRMAELTAGADPKRAALLRRSVAQSKEHGIALQMDKVVEILGHDKLADALKDQQAVGQDLSQLLDLLLSEQRSEHLKDERQRLKRQIQQLKELINKQIELKAETARAPEAKDLAKPQGRLAEETGRLAREMDNSPPGAKAGDQNGKQPTDKGQGGEKSKKPDGEKPDSKKTNGEKPDGKKSGDEKSKSAKPGAKSDKNQKSGKPAEGDQPSGDKQKSGKPADPQSGDKQQAQKPGEQQGESSKSQKSKSGKPQQGKPQRGKQSGQPGAESPDGEQQPDEEQIAQQQQEDQQSPGRKRVAAARKAMEEAQKKLEQAKREGAQKEQEEALRQLEQAKAELEEILRQLRDEEVERVLAQLEARFRHMLALEREVYEGTKRLDKVPHDKRGRNDEIEAGRVSRRQAVVVIEAEKALAVLHEEGSAVALPEAVEEMREDMETVVGRLAQAKVDAQTQGIEEDIIAGLEEAIAALQRAQRDRQQKKAAPAAGGQPGEPPLVDGLAELKMIRALQMRVNTRTERYSKLVSGELGQGETPELLDALKRLAEREQRIFRATHDIVVGKNQ